MNNRVLYLGTKDVSFIIKLKKTKRKEDDPYFSGRKSMK